MLSQTNVDGDVPQRQLPLGLWTYLGPTKYVLDVGPDPPWEAAFLRGMTLGFPACRWAPFPVASASGFPRMLSTSISIGRLQKQSSVTVNFPVEKSPPAMQPFDRIVWPLVPAPQPHTTILWSFFRDHPREPVSEENFWTLWCKGRLTEADTLTIQLGATPSGLTSAHLHHPPIFYRPDALPAAQPCQSTEGN